VLLEVGEEVVGGFGSSAGDGYGAGKVWVILGKGAGKVWMILGKATEIGVVRCMLGMGWVSNTITTVVEETIQ